MICQTEGPLVAQVIWGIILTYVWIVMSHSKDPEKTDQYIMESRAVFFSRHTFFFSKVFLFDCTRPL